MTDSNRRKSYVEGGLASTPLRLAYGQLLDAGVGPSEWCHERSQKADELELRHQAVGDERFVMRFYDRAPDACTKEARILRGSAPMSLCRACCTPVS